MEVQKKYHVIISFGEKLTGHFSDIIEVAGTIRNVPFTTTISKLPDRAPP